MTDGGTTESEPEDVPLPARLSDVWPHDYPHPWDCSFQAKCEWDRPDVDELSSVTDEWFLDHGDVVIYSPTKPERWVATPKREAVDLTDWA